MKVKDIDLKLLKMTLKQNNKNVEDFKAGSYLKSKALGELVVRRLIDVKDGRIKLTPEFWKLWNEVSFYDKCFRILCAAFTPEQVFKKFGVGTYRHTYKIVIKDKVHNQRLNFFMLVTLGVYQLSSRFGPSYINYILDDGAFDTLGHRYKSFDADRLLDYSKYCKIIAGRQNVIIPYDEVKL